MSRPSGLRVIGAVVHGNENGSAEPVTLTQPPPRGKSNGTWPTLCVLQDYVEAAAKTARFLEVFSPLLCA